MDTQALISIDLALMVLAPIGILLLNTIFAVIFASIISIGILYAEHLTYKQHDIKQVMREQLKYP